MKVQANFCYFLVLSWILCFLRPTHRMISWLSLNSVPTICCILATVGSLDELLGKLSFASVLQCLDSFYTPSVGCHFRHVKSYFKTEEAVTNIGGHMVLVCKIPVLLQLISRNYTPPLLHVQLGGASEQDCTCFSIVIISPLLTPSQLEQADLHQSCICYVLCS